MNRRQFGLAGMATLAGALTSPAWAAAVPPTLRVVFHAAPADMPLGWYQAGLEDRLEELREAGVSFHEVRVPRPDGLRGKGHLTGICLFPIDDIPSELAMTFAVFLMQTPGRRVCADLGENEITLSTLDDVLRLSASLARDAHVF